MIKRFLLAYLSQVKKWMVVAFLVCLILQAFANPFQGLANVVGLQILPIFPIVGMYKAYRNRNN